MHARARTLRLVLSLLFVIGTVSSGMQPVAAQEICRKGGFPVPQSPVILDVCTTPTGQEGAFVALRDGSGTIVGVLVARRTDEFGQGVIVVCVTFRFGDGEHTECQDTSPLD
jgi:hypothetical protein